MPRMLACGAAPGGDSSRGPRHGQDALPRSVSCLLTSSSSARSSRSKLLRTGDGGACSVPAATACRLPGSVVVAAAAFIRGGGGFGGGGGGGGGGACGGSMSMARARTRRSQRIKPTATRTERCIFCTCFLMPNLFCELAFPRHSKVTTAQGQRTILGRMAKLRG